MKPPANGASGFSSVCGKGASSVDIATPVHGNIIKAMSKSEKKQGYKCLELAFPTSLRKTVL